MHNGEHVNERKTEAWDHHDNFYGIAMTAAAHIPSTMVAIDKDDGWDIYSYTLLYLNLEETPASGESRVKNDDDDGKK